jgi:hypothetical protein
MSIFIAVVGLAALFCFLADDGDQRSGSGRSYDSFDDYS